MIRRAVLALISALLLATPALADPELPALDAEGLNRPLRPDQLDPAERTQYANLPPGSAEARQFLYTRGFLRYARLVVEKKLPAAQLPPLPERSNWNRRFLSEAEAKGVVDVALEMNMATMVRIDVPLLGATAASRDLPGTDANGKSLPLRPEQLNAVERAAYDRLPAGSEDSRKYLATRGFLRYARRVLDRTLPALQLPDLPVGWDRQHLSKQEASDVDLALGLWIVATMKPPS